MNITSVSKVTGLLLLAALIATAVVLYPQLAQAPLSQTAGPPAVDFSESAPAPLEMVESAEPAAAELTTRSVEFSYDGANRMTRMEYADGSKVTFELDASGNPVSQGSSVLLHLPHVER